MAQVTNTESKKRVEVDADTLDQLEASIGRYAHENSRFRSAAKKGYKGMVKPEDAIRQHAIAKCDCDSDRECLANLYRLVPKHKRPRRRHG